MFKFKSKMMSKSISKSSTSSSSGDNGTQPYITIADLICNRRWTLLEKYLIDGTALDMDIDDPSMAEHVITEDIIVHFAVRFQAPLRTVSLLTRFYPSSVSSPDASGRYPIHVACKWSATPNVISHLIRLNSSACDVQDDLGKTPMHYFAEFYIANYQHSLKLYPMDESMMVVVKLLRSAAPSSLNLEDNEGCNAIEYALDNNVHIQVIKSMQRACSSDWKQRSTAGDSGVRRRHSAVMKDLKALALTKREEIMKNGVYGVNSILSEPNIGRRGSIIKVTNGRVHVDSSTQVEKHKPKKWYAAAARSA